MSFTFKSLLQLIIFLILILIFIFEYVTDVWKKFTDEATTFTTRRRPIEAVLWPAMTICIENVMKASVLKAKTGTSTRRMFRDNMETQLNQSLWDLYYQASYKLDQDFRMEILTKDLSELHLGNNAGLMIEEFPTKFYGLCYSLTGLENKAKEYDGQMIIGVIPKKHHSNADNPPTGVSVFFTSKETRHNIVTEYWPFVDPLSLQKKFAFKFMVSVNLHQVHWGFYQGNQNCSMGCSINRCIGDGILVENSCPQPCVPVTLARLFPNSTLPPCHSIEDNACMYHHIMAHLGSDQDCERPMHDMQYVAYQKEGQYLNMHNPADAVYVLITHKSKHEMVKQEIRIYDTLSLIGTIGGTLGLFIGFSFLGFVNTVLDYVFSRI